MNNQGTAMEPDRAELVGLIARGVVACHVRYGAVDTLRLLKTLTEEVSRREGLNGGGDTPSGVALQSAIWTFN